MFDIRKTALFGQVSGNAESFRASAISAISAALSARLVDAQDAESSILSVLSLLDSKKGKFKKQRLLFLKALQGSYPDASGKQYFAITGVEFSHIGKLRDATRFDGSTIESSILECYDALIMAAATDTPTDTPTGTDTPTPTDTPTGTDTTVDTMLARAELAESAVKILEYKLSLVFDLVSGSKTKLAESIREILSA